MKIRIKTSTFTWKWIDSLKKQCNKEVQRWEERVWKLDSDIIESYSMCCYITFYLWYVSDFTDIQLTWKNENRLLKPYCTLSFIQSRLFLKDMYLLLQLFLFLYLKIISIISVNKITKKKTERKKDAQKTCFMWKKFTANGANSISHPHKWS